MEVKFIFLDRGVVPNIHDRHEEESEEDGEPGTFPELCEGGGEVEQFYKAEEEQERESYNGGFVPTEDDNQGSEACRH